MLVTLCQVPAGTMTHQPSVTSWSKVNSSLRGPIWARPRPRSSRMNWSVSGLSLIHISEPTRLLSISYAVFCLKKKKNNMTKKNPNFQFHHLQKHTQEIHNP